MADNNPLELYYTLKSTLERYIPTTLPISRRYPALDKKFRQLIQEQKLVKGPYLESLPDFEKGPLLRTLLKEKGGFLHNSLSGLPEHILDRALHKHQEKAFRLTCEENKNILVATGTGSGKTETFLYPLAHHLLNDPEPDKPGVRTLLIYPMNALANDQLYYRIAPLFGVSLVDAGITFGRFTSQIRANTKRSEEESRLFDNEKLMKALGNPSKMPENWLLTREEMLANPPKILITNYAMLEHLLLLPRNSPLFAQNTLRHIVLDEIHTYVGAQATEVAYLLRKLKNRLGLDRKLTVYGTSASLPNGEGDDEKVIEFASNLFGEKIDEVVRGKRIPHELLVKKSNNSFSLEMDVWIHLGEVLNQFVQEESQDQDLFTWNELINDADLSGKIPKLVDNGEPWAAMLEKVFSRNQEIRKVSSILQEGGIKPFTEVAKAIFNDSSDSRDLASALSNVIHLGMLARAHDDAFPLLPARYHLAVNSIEGISIKLADNAEGWDDITALRNYESEEGLYFPLLVCRKCGQPYIEVFEYNNRLYNRYPVLDSGKALRRVMWLGKPPESVTEDEEDELEISDKQGNAIQYNFDINTGKLLSDPDEGITLFEIQTKEDEEEKAFYVKQCPACGGKSSGRNSEIVTRMHPGNEALGSVVVQKILEALPVEVDAIEPLPMGGRSLLSFSDNRQNAAFFAPYFERTSGDFALRSAIYQALNETDVAFDLDSLFEAVYKQWKKLGEPVLIDENGEIRSLSHKMRDRLMGKIAAEFCTPGGRRNSLEALGLVRVSINSKKFNRLIQRIKDSLPDDFKSQPEPLLRFLLETMRREKAIGDLYDVDMKAPFIWGDIYAKPRSFSIHPDSSNTTKAWIPAEGTKRFSRRTWYLVERLGWSWEEAREFLGAVWDVMIRDKIIIRLKPGYGINGRLIEFENGENFPLYICKTCGMKQVDVVDMKCTAFKCQGVVEEYSQTERAELTEKNHYINSYKSGVVSTVRAREHTASLSTDLRETIEGEFSKGKINLLSCTTTMEMGVDLGDLNAVVNLNIPPGVANYQQRTGRAGRRAQAAPFCVTVARNSQYDQAMFRKFHQYLSSDVPIPYIRLDNPQLFQRHQVGVILTYFLKKNVRNIEKNAPALSDLFGSSFNEDENSKFIDNLDYWIESDHGSKAILEAENLAEKLPNDLKNEIGLFGKPLIEHFREKIVLFAQEVKERWIQYTNKMDEISDDADSEDEAKNLSKKLRWASLRKQYLQQFLVNQLSQRGLIPTYSFPVHSLTLEISKEFSKQNFYGNNSDIALSRDASQGISEYAPGAEVIANGRIWRSSGLAYYPKDFMPDEHYSVCSNCYHVETAISRDELPATCSNCDSTQIKKNTYIRPRGFVTSYEDRKGRDPGTTRRRIRPAEEARLITIPNDELFEETAHKGIRTALLKSIANGESDLNGRMFVVNRGAYSHGYNYCRVCNYAEASLSPVTKKMLHKQPMTGSICQKSGPFYSVDLVHEFNTDVLIIRFLQKLPEPDSTEQNPHHFIENFSRTLVEALRFAAADIMEIQSSEFRSSYRLHGETVDMILYDSVSGGAGYCKRLKGMSILNLLKSTLKQLDCPKECSTSCSECLCDYSNQRYWDQLDRNPVRQWLDKIIEGVADDPYEKLGAVYWKKPSLKSLSNDLSGYDDIILIGKKLDSDSGGNQNILNWLREQMNNGKKVTIYILDEMPKAIINASPRLRETLLHLYPYIQTNDLKINRLKDFEEKNLSLLPRILSGTGLNSTVWISSYSSPALLDQLLPDPIYKYKIDQSFADLLPKILKNSINYEVKDFNSTQPVERWEFKEGDDRSLGGLFSIIDNAYIEELVIKDPYCAEHEELLLQLLEIILKKASEVEKLIIHAKELSKHHNNHRPVYIIKNSLDRQVAQVFPNPRIMIHDFYQGRSFHDRTIEIKLVDKDGIPSSQCYDLTAGVDYLLDKNKATKVYRYALDD